MVLPPKAASLPKSPSQAMLRGCAARNFLASPQRRLPPPASVVPSNTNPFHKRVEASGRWEDPGMGRQHLIIVCGVPGSGKSTLAHHAVDRWGAVSFASETFADKLGAAARTSSGDLSKEAIVHAYAAMGAAVSTSLETQKLVLAVGSFRAEDQRRQFRDIAEGSGASVTTLRIACPVETAAERVRARMALGERGPTEEAIRQIDAELNRASDIDLVLANDTSIEHFHRRADSMMEFHVNAVDQLSATELSSR
jgi:predicted kinase